MVSRRFWAKIAIDNNIGEGTVSGVVSDFKIGLDNSEFDSVRQFAIDVKKQGLSLSDLASHFRLYNYFRKSGASEDEIESFVANISSSDIPPENVVELVNQVFNISKKELVSLDQIPCYIKQNLEDMQKIDQEIKETDTTLQSKNVTIEAINEHLKLKEELNKHGLSIHNIDELLNLLLNAKDYGFQSKKIVGKLRSIRRLEKSSNEFKKSWNNRRSDIILEQFFGKEWV
jgi:hypothetical protein